MTTRKLKDGRCFDKTISFNKYGYLSMMTIKAQFGVGILDVLCQETTVDERTGAAVGEIIDKVKD